MVIDGIVETVGEVATEAVVPVVESATNAVQSAAAPLAENIGSALSAGAEAAGTVPLVTPGVLELGGFLPGAFDANASKIVTSAVNEGGPHAGMEALANLPDAAKPDSVVLDAAATPAGVLEEPTDQPVAAMEEGSSEELANAAGSSVERDGVDNVDVADAIQAALKDVPENVQAQAEDLLHQIDTLDPATLEGIDPVVFSEMIKNHSGELAISPFNLQSFLDAHYATDAQMMEDNFKAMGMDANGKRMDETELRQIQIQAQMEAWRQRIARDPNMPDEEKRIAIEKVSALETKLIMKEQLTNFVKKVALRLLGVGQLINSSSENVSDSISSPATATGA